MGRTTSSGRPEIESAPFSSLCVPLIAVSDAHTAVLFFSHRPEREWGNKQFVRQDYAKHRRIATALYRHSRRAVDESGFPVLEMTDSRQRGDGFGTRLANALSDAFAEGYDQLIVVGSDCPRLHEVDWTAVSSRLKDGRPVLGPTVDGEGAYLIGVRRDQFSRARFEALPWQSSRLFTALAHHLSMQATGSVAVLPARDDVNGHRDLIAFVRESSSPNPLVDRLRRVLGRGGRGVFAEESVSRRRAVRRRSRAPPVFSGE